MYEMSKKRMEEIFNIASITLAEKGELAPMYFVITGDEELIPLIGQGVDLDELAAAAVHTAHETNADAIILLCEQTMVSLRKDDPELQDYIDGKKRPSEAKNKEDYLTLTHMTKDGETDSIVAKIIMSPNGVRYVNEYKWISEAVTNMITPWA